MKILVINSGSQTLKYELFEKRDSNSNENEELVSVLEGTVKDIGFSEVKDHYEAFNLVKEKVKDHEDSIKIIGHRYVNGGVEFREPTLVTEENIDNLAKYNDLAPLHNPHNLAGIKASLSTFSTAQNVAVFDTYYYKDLEEKVWRYPINKELADQFGYRKFGFHGTSHRYVCKEAAKKLNRDLSELKLISVHLGGGASITATKYGKAIDTSMGYTPLEGLTMMTRSGDIDPGLIIDLVNKGYDGEKIDDLLNNESGLFGLSGKNGMLDILDNLSDPKVKLAFDIYVYRIKKYVGAYFAALNGCDAIIFTGSVGSGREETRNLVMTDMDFMKDVPVLPIETNEELMIARDALKTINF